jgi:predicted metal-binding membrane protein
MTYGLAQVGRPMPFRASLVAFFGMWITMMVAIMPPGAAPSVVGQGIRARPARSAAVGALAFACSYLAVWTLSGVVPL